MLADAESRICEIPEIQESDGSVIKSLTPSRQPHESDYETSKLISSGNFGAVYLAHHKDSHQIFALKKMAKRNLDTPKRVEWAFLERDILTFADSPFLMPGNSLICVQGCYGASESDRARHRSALGHIPPPVIIISETLSECEYR
ncbi:microtubule-associated serine/threonine-protein kinase 3-like [Phyllobates terribilis]|uniref:microtubule-associated serine/threonine-protein kinase 3-like n=1 Tax=Phyllobates terribilis TaxID=111132 RepID=UPI003CCAD431